MARVTISLADPLLELDVALAPKRNDSASSACAAVAFTFAFDVAHCVLCYCFFLGRRALMVRNAEVTSATASILRFPLHASYCYCSRLSSIGGRRSGVKRGDIASFARLAN